MADIKSAISSRMKSKFLGAIIAAVAFLVALIIGIAAGGDRENKVLWAFGLAFTCAFLTSALCYYIIAAVYKSKLTLLLAEGETIIGVIFLLAMLSIEWWLIVVITVVSIVVAFFSMLMIHSDQMALVTDDMKPGYKNWKEREAEKAATSVIETEEELPEIKSFK